MTTLRQHADRLDADIAEICALRTQQHPLLSPAKVAWAVVFGTVATVLLLVFAR